MRAQLRSFYCTDIEIDTYEPSDPSVDGQWVRMIVGPAIGPGEESFDVLICTPRWLETHVQTEGPIVGRHLLIANRFDLPPLLDRLRDLVNATTGSNWNEVGEKLGRIGHWEFEDYQP